MTHNLCMSATIVPSALLMKAFSPSFPPSRESTTLGHLRGAHPTVVRQMQSSRGRYFRGDDEDGAQPTYHAVESYR